VGQRTSIFVGVVSNLATHEVLSANFVHESMEALGFNHVIQLFLRLVPAGKIAEDGMACFWITDWSAYEVEKLLGKV
jgi:hypothetical protein